MDKVPHLRKKPFKVSFDSTAVEYSISKLGTPECIEITGSRVWGLNEDSSDLDILFFGNYEKIVDHIIYFDKYNIEIEITLIPLEDVFKRSIDIELRWDIISGYFYSCDAWLSNKIVSHSLLLKSEARELLLDFIDKVSWLGFGDGSVVEGRKLYSDANRYLNIKKYKLSNTYNVLFYVIDKIVKSQYILNLIPYPFVKWRIQHLDKLWNVSNKLLDLLNYIEYNKNDNIEYIFEMTRDAFIDTVRIAANAGLIETPSATE